MPGKLVLDNRKGILKIENKRKKTKNKNGDVPSASPPCTIGFCAPVWLLAPQERTKPGVELRRLDKI